MIVYGDRTRSLPPPPHALWRDLVAPRVHGTRAWLHLRDDEIAPQVLQADEPTLVVWSSLWPDRHNDRIHLDLRPGHGGTLLRFRLIGHDEPGPGLTGRIRFRINHILWSDLRLSYGQ